MPYFVTVVEIIGLPRAPASWVRHPSCGADWGAQGSASAKAPTLLTSLVCRVCVSAFAILHVVVVSVVDKHDPVIDERVYRHGESNGFVLALANCL